MLRFFKGPSRLACGALLCCFGLSACVTSGSLRSEFERGKQAYQSGRVLASYRILHGMDMSGKVPPKEFYKVMDEVNKATEYLMAQWLEEGQRSVEEGDLSRALGYYEDLLLTLPSGDPLRGKLEEKAAPIRKQIEDLRSEILTILEQAHASFLAGKIEEARLRLIDAREQSYKHRLDFPMEQERLLAECDRRLPAPVVELSEVEAPGPVESKVDIAKLTKVAKKKRARRRRPRRRPKPRRRPDVPRATAVDNEVAGLMKEADKLKKKRHWADAIVAYRRVLRKDSDHQDAKKALRQLESVRKKLLAAWTKEAEEYFAKERLDKAAPLYRRILKIDPGNLRAKEGLQMFKRLKELKGKKN
ncbi:MAG: hypothetical protein JRF33_22355 [Deltaproteobacteria bacterium]|nr:hypothetical protein [Deltaproteobacteria bacterium]